MVATRSSAENPRLLALDAVRALAILLVIGHHAAYRFIGSKDDVVAAFLRSVGWIGVDVFFALSGFLIVRILLRDAAAHDIAGFFCRRFYRIVPIFAVALVVFAIGALITGQESGILHRLWMPALLLNGWLIPFFGVDQVQYVVAWSLSVEEFAYIVLGLCALASRKSLWRGVVTFLLIAVMVRWSVLASHAFKAEYLYYFVPARLDAIAFGGLGAFGVYDRLLRYRYCSWLAGLTTVGLMVAFQWTPVNGWVLPGIGYSVFGLVCGIWVSSLGVGAPKPTGLFIRAIAPLGKLSYFIYLFHLFALEAVRKLSSNLLGFEISFWPGMLLATALCFIAARISWRYFEAPLIRLARNRARGMQSPVQESP